jgi:hypothetical protein
MGFMKNYDTIGSFITVSNDAFNRLKPGFEARPTPSRRSAATSARRLETAPSSSV